MPTIPPCPELSPQILVRAYSSGYFPMPHPQNGDIVFLRPDPRAILPMGGFHCSRSLRRSLRQRGFVPVLNRDFVGCMRACADREESWIDERFIAGYGHLHSLGLAHSLEIYQGQSLVGGLYGLALGGAFFAESKFHRVSDGSKAALFALSELLLALDFKLLEVQFLTDHLQSLGVIELPHSDYEPLLKAALTHVPRHRLNSEEAMDCLKVLGEQNFSGKP